MAAIPGYQFYSPKAVFLDSIHGSVSKFDAIAPFHFFRYYASSLPINTRSSVSATHGCCSSQFYSTAPPGNPRKRFNRLLRNKKGRPEFSSGASISYSNSSCSSGGDLSRSSWLSNWNVSTEPFRRKKPQQAAFFRNSGDVSNSDAEEGTSTSTRSSTVERIVEKLKKFGYIDDVSDDDDDDEGRSGGFEKGSIEDIFQVEEGLLPNTMGGFSEEFPFGDKSVVSRGNGEVRFPWERKEENEHKPTVDSRKSRNLAELTLPESEIRRLTNLSLRVKNKTKVGGAGVTQQVVDMIHEKWKSSEVIRLKIEGPPALNMRRVHEILERKTGGLVIWRSGTSVALYRGAAYVDPTLKFKKNMQKKNELPHKTSSPSGEADQDSSGSGPKARTSVPRAEAASGDPKDICSGSSSEVGYDEEIDKLLETLGPRFEDWPGDGPLPVDADLLPSVDPGYQPPFRLLPYGVRSTLGMKEATALRRLARGLPPHFALGRSRQLQGLAAAMIKLWERSSIAKIALKRGVQLTTSERMAEDLKTLTGGKLLSRNKDFLVYYRGKDFLSPEVAEALLEKERLAKALQDEEEQARLRSSNLVVRSVEDADESGVAGTLKETLDADNRWGKQLDDDHKEKVLKEAEVLRHAEIVRKLERKLDFALRKLTKAEKALSKVEESLTPKDPSDDPESLSDEERFMFRKLGLRMKAFLLLGRRGVFDGTVENMHLHWKYRELVKIIVKAPNIGEVKNIALALEAESGGVLVSVDKVSKGYAVIVFRGRDYKRPPLLRPKNLLTKRKALARSIELQRRKALMDHILTVQKRVNQLRSEIEQMAIVKDQGDEELYNKLDLANPTDDDEDSEEEGGDGNNNMVDENNDTVHYAYLETDDELYQDDQGIDPAQSTYPDTNFPCAPYLEPKLSGKDI